MWGSLKRSEKGGRAKVTPRQTALRCLDRYHIKPRCRVKGVPAGRRKQHHATEVEGARA